MLEFSLSFVFTHAIGTVDFMKNSDKVHRTSSTETTRFSVALVNAYVFLKTFPNFPLTCLMAFFPGSLSVHVLMVLHCKTGRNSFQKRGCSNSASLHLEQTAANAKRSEEEKYQKNWVRNRGSCQSSDQGVNLQWEKNA